MAAVKKTKEPFTQLCAVELWASCRIHPSSLTLMRREVFKRAFKVNNKLSQRSCDVSLMQWGFLGKLFLFSPTDGVERGVLRSPTSKHLTAIKRKYSSGGCSSLPAWCLPSLRPSPNCVCTCARVRVCSVLQPSLIFTLREEDLWDGRRRPGDEIHL